MDRALFFAEIRLSLFQKGLKQSQVEGIDYVLDYWTESGLTDIRWLSYMLATDHWETAQTFQAIEEYGKGKGRTYGVPDKRTGKTYYGRGLVQLTWYDNYKKLGDLLGLDLVNKPELALDLHTATQIMFVGMVQGLFTGKSLENYFSTSVDDPKNARRIINGTDKAAEIAAIYQKFLSALKAAGAPVPTTTDKPFLKLGMSGPAVVEWQAIVGVVGDFGPATEAATKAWQKARGLEADGKVGPATWRAAS